jgi:ABC-2 type transport system permease protein
MSVGAIARKDIADAGRSQALWALTAVVVLFTAGLTALFGLRTDGPVVEVFDVSFQLVAVGLPIVALFMAKGSLSGERESGSLRMLLSLPPSRRDILFGKFVGRTALLLIAALAGAATTGLVVFALFDSGLELLVPFIGFLSLMGITFIAIGIGISAATGSDGRATAFSVGVYMIFVAFWSLIQNAIRFGATELGLAETNSQSAWLQFIEILAPNQAALAAYEHATTGNLLTIDPLASTWLPTLVMFGWVFVPVVCGYLRFRTADIA